MKVQIRVGNHCCPNYIRRCRRRAIARALSPRATPRAPCHTPNPLSHLNHCMTAECLFFDNNSSRYRCGMVFHLGTALCYRTLRIYPTLGNTRWSIRHPPPSNADGDTPQCSSPLHRFPRTHPYRKARHTHVSEAWRTNRRPRAVYSGTAEGAGSAKCSMSVTRVTR
mgnify:CR=1 FL=1